MIIERDPLLALQGAMNVRLVADQQLMELGARVFDRVSDDYFPRIVIGEDLGNPEDTDCYSATDVLSTVRVYSQAVGKVEAKQIAERVRFLLTRASGFEVPGFELSIGHCESVNVRPHADGIRTQAELNFSYRLIAV